MLLQMPHSWFLSCVKQETDSFSVQCGGEQLTPPFRKTNVFTVFGVCFSMTIVLLPNGFQPHFSVTVDLVCNITEMSKGRINAGQI